MKKVEPLRSEQTGPRSPCLLLSTEKLPGAVEKVIKGWLFIGSGKRLLLLCLEPCMELHILKQELMVTIDRYNVRVEIKGGDRMNTQQDVQINAVCQPMFTVEKIWPVCEAMHDLVDQVKDLEGQKADVQSQVEELQLQLEELDDQTKKTQAAALDILMTILGASQQPQ